MGAERFGAVAREVAELSGLEGRWVGDDFVTFVNDGIRLVLTDLDGRSFSYLFFQLGDLDYRNGIRAYKNANPREFAHMLTTPLSP